MSTRCTRDLRPGDRFRFVSGVVHTVKTNNPPVPGGTTHLLTTYEGPSLASQADTRWEVLLPGRAQNYEPDPLSQHLKLSRKMGWFMVIMLGIVLVVWLAAVVLSGFAPGVIFTGAGTLLLGILFACRSYRADVLETDRLLDEAIGGLDLTDLTDNE